MEERKAVKVDGKSITYFLSEKAVHIDNNDELKSIIQNPKAAMKLARELSERIRKKTICIQDFYGY